MQGQIFLVSVLFYIKWFPVNIVQGATAMEMISSILKDEPKPLNIFDIHPDLEEIIAKTLKKDLGERYSNTKELLADLRLSRKELNLKPTLNGPLHLTEQMKKRHRY